MSAAAFAAFALFVAGAALALAQIWLAPLLPETFSKALVTLAILLALVVAWALLQRERRDNARLRDPKQRD